MFRFQPAPRTEDRNTSLVRNLEGCGSIPADMPQLAEAFLSVDRGQFVPPEAAEHAYDNAPFRFGVFHLSQPSLYADALVALDLRPGLSFLNIGSGTGYLSCIVGKLIGDGVHHGIELHKELVDFATEQARKGGVQATFLHGNANDIDCSGPVRYDRIYIGACVAQHQKALMTLLAVGGILVAPFESEASHEFRCVKRVSSTRFEIQNLKAVQFACLREPEKNRSVISLPVPGWTPRTHKRFPGSFRRALLTTLMAVRRTGVQCDVCVTVMFGFLHGRWFEQEEEITEICEVANAPQPVVVPRRAQNLYAALRAFADRRAAWPLARYTARPPVPEPSTDPEPSDESSEDEPEIEDEMSDSELPDVQDEREMPAQRPRVMFAPRVQVA
mmetsp:Transcript_32467/g.84297  ORF Transcript_32467/g.84297 Transcript_32467/m.84297 type:complete len:387 (+) Transcript_32467:31-1191(+)